MATRKKICVIVPHWRKLGKTINCLSSLKNDLFPKEIIVVNNGPKSDGQILKRQFPEIILIQNLTNLGYCKGNNQGLRYAVKNNFPYALLINDDVTLRPKALTGLVETAENYPKAAGVNPVILFPNSEKIWFGGCQFIWWLGTLKNMYKFSSINFLPKNPWPTKVLTGACLLLKLNLLGKNVLLDEDYFAYWEELDLSTRIHQIGFQTLVTPLAQAEHHQDKTFSFLGSPRLSSLTAYLVTRNGFIFARKNLKGVKKLIFLLVSVTFRLGYTLIHTQNLKAIAWTFQGLIAGLQRKTGVPPKAIFQA